MENFLSLKPVEFYLRGINNQVIENNGEYIEINLLNYFWINSILLKWRLFMTEPNIQSNWKITPFFKKFLVIFLFY